MGKNQKAPEDNIKVTPKEKEPNPVPFDELLLKTIGVKPRKKKGGK